MATKYNIVHSPFLGNWSVTSPTQTVDYGAGPVNTQEGKLVDTHAEAVGWMNEHAAMTWLRHYYAHTAAEPVIP